MGENKLRCMTWSEQESSAVLADAYTACVRAQTVLWGFSVRYMSYELLSHQPPLAVLSSYIYIFSGSG